MSVKIIKVEDKFYIQETTETETTLEELEKEKADLEANKQVTLDKQSEACDNAVAELATLIEEIKVVGAEE